MTTQNTLRSATNPPVEYDDPPEEDLLDCHHKESRDNRSGASRDSSMATSGEPRVHAQFHERGEMPAHVTPIENVSHISSLGRPTIPEAQLKGLVGQPITECGDVVDSDNNSCILGQVAGDLPGMVGRRVTTDKGDVLGDDGDLLGYVQHVGPESDSRGEGKGDEPRGSAQTLESFTQGGSRSFTVDDDGNILDESGTMVGKMNSNKSQWTTKGGPESVKTGPAHTQDKESPPKQNAETFRKENDSPSDIFLDVKSTREGIQLVIRVPTVFPGSTGPSIRIT